MALDKTFRVRHNTLVPVAEAMADQAIVNRMGFQVVTDFFTQMILSGRAYHIQVGTEDAGVEISADLDDELAFIICDNSVGNCMMPLLYEATPGVIAGAKILQAALTVDKDIVRYSSAGTAYVPANLRGDDRNAASGVFYVQSDDVIPVAASASPNCIDLARQDFLEDTIAASIGYPGMWNTLVYSIRKRPSCAIIDAGSIVCQFGANTDQPVSYGCMEFAQFPKALVT